MALAPVHAQSEQSRGGLHVLFADDDPGMRAIVMINLEAEGFEPALAAAFDSALAGGVAVVDVRVQRIDLPDDVAARVYESMKQGFARTALRLRAEGQSASTGIKAAADRRRTEILANAERDALRIRGEGDAASTQIYAHAYSKDPEFYAFYRSLQAYERALGKDGDLLVLTPDGEFFQYLKDPEKRRGAK